ncbi:DUF805 domain-containing protein [Sandaracinobacteroides hominis]|uniref:DUF805 domain-containing protein n=1 Tax=Sandaracinobacteroides hominis TaxID=2780086 RepID=UPI0018F686FD|nr:DUF805 domain-containing protein [Sandaracinobacteroides hominis]
MSLMFEPLRKFATFSGRARRREYWLWQLFIWIISAVLFAWLFAALPDKVVGTDEFFAMSGNLMEGPTRLPMIVIALVSLALFLPSLAVSVRRLHDSDKSGWWLLLNLLAIGALVLLIFFLIDGTRGPNSYGPDPKGRPGPAS